MGVPFVAVKATSAVHGKMLEKIGADKIIYPERDMGKRVAHNLISSSIVDYIEMSNNISLMSTNIPHSLVGKTLSNPICANVTMLTSLPSSTKA